VAACFFIGAVVRTRAGRFFYRGLEERILRAAPGYSLIKEIVVQFFGPPRRALFGRGSGAALRHGGENDRLHQRAPGRRQLFGVRPLGAQPDTGLVLHLPAELVEPLSATVEEAMRTLIACGSGSHRILPRRGPRRSPKMNAIMCRAMYILPITVDFFPRWCIFLYLAVFPGVNMKEKRVRKAALAVALLSRSGPRLRPPSLKKVICLGFSTTAFPHSEPL